MTAVRCLGAVALALALAACGSTGTDKAAPSTTSTTPTSSTAAMTPVPPPPPGAPGRPVAFRDYLSSIGVTGVPAHFDNTPGLQVTVPVPDGWARTSDPLFATGIDFIQPLGDKTSSPTTSLMAIALNGDFDPKDAITHANTDALPPTATDITQSFDDYDGFPSAVAEGTTAGTQHYNRIVLATVPSTNTRYLVQLTVTTPLDQPIAASPALNTVVSGFKVTVT